MQLLFRQRFFSWFDSYDIHDEAGNTAFTVEGKLAWGHRLHILDASGRHVATVKERVLTLLPRFELYEGDTRVGEVQKEFTLLRPRYRLDFRAWSVQGNLLGWDYSVTNGSQRVATISKKLFNWTDTYSLDIVDPADQLHVLMVVLAIDAANCSQNG